MKIRKHICCWLFEITKTPYSKYIKQNDAWNITREQLIDYPTESLGYAVGTFLIDNNYQFVPKLENHDVYHVITEYSTTVKDEIALQYFFLGNGKNSIYLYGVVFIGGLLFPEYYNHFNTAFQKGKNTTPFFNWDLQQLLPQPLKNIREAIYTNNISNIELF